MVNEPGRAADRTTHPAFSVTLQPSPCRVVPSSGAVTGTDSELRLDLCIQPLRRQAAPPGIACRDGTESSWASPLAEGYLKPSVQATWELPKPKSESRLQACAAARHYCAGRTDQLNR